MCPGNVDSKIIQLANDRKGSFLSPEGQLLQIERMRKRGSTRHFIINNCTIMCQS